MCVSNWQIFPIVKTVFLKSGLSFHLIITLHLFSHALKVSKTVHVQYCVEMQTYNYYSELRSPVLKSLVRKQSNWICKFFPKLTYLFGNRDQVIPPIYVG